jgi:hypothetical protein
MISPIGLFVRGPIALKKGKRSIFAVRQLCFNSVQGGFAVSNCNMTVASAGASTLSLHGSNDGAAGMRITLIYEKQVGKEHLAFPNPHPS